MRLYFFVRLCFWQIIDRMDIKAVGMYYIGIDLGTSSLKAVIADKTGTIIGQAKRGYPLAMPRDNWSEQNPADWYDACIQVLRELGGGFDLSAVAGLSFSGQMHGLVILDKDDNIIRPAILWNDNRTAAECDYLNTEIGRDKLIDWTGNIAFTGFTAPKVLWLKNNEKDNYKKIAKAMLPKDFLAYKLSGVFATDVSDASGTLYFDVKAKAWSKPVLEILGLRREQLPAIFESYNVIGKVKKEIAALTGLSENCAVIIGAGDQAAGAIGTGTTGGNALSISLGTSGVVFAASDRFVLDKKARLHSFCHANGGYHVMGVMLSAAGSTKWWAEDILQTDDYGKIFKETAALPIDDLLFLPYLTGERSPINDPCAVGGFYGLRANTTRAAMTKAVLEGVCFGLKDCLNAIDDLGVAPTSARVIGGGAKSKEWLQILADVSGLKLHAINTEEGGALGAVILAMAGTGLYKDVQSACAAIIKDKETVSPIKANTAAYAKKFTKYKALYENVKNKL